MEATKFREMGDDELTQKRQELREEIFHLRLRRATGQLENPMKPRQVRRDLARLESVWREREIRREAESPK